MSISTKYDPKEVEGKWYDYWLENDHFAANPNPAKEPFSIVIPPPNVTGVLHMGHMLNNTIQDILIRKARMEGKEACWVPGTDHASIATEAKVVQMLREKGIKKSDLSREDFLKHAWEWKEKYGGIILEQLKKLGASCDWSRTAFTMDKDYYEAVIRVFVDLYKKGYIYRGLRMINWDCEAQTALSNEEVLYNEEGETSILYSVKYQIKDSNDYVVIATQRPETIMGDTAIAVNPKDKRHKHLIGQKALVPFINREIPIIGDDYVELDFGTGCLKVTPAHDQNDYEIGLRHNLEVVDTINLDGTLNEKCEVPSYVGKDRFEVRELVIADLKAADLIVKEEEFVTKIGRSERTNTVVEPKLSLQWFIKMKEISRRAHAAVMEDEILLYPAKFKNTYNHWMENVRDWCISRQLWWGQRIPAYYYGNGEDDFVVAENLSLALEMARDKTGNAGLTEQDLEQDPDVLDTWASSWLFPIEVFHGFKEEDFDFDKGKIHKSNNADLDYFYPTDTLVTAPEILFFWVARMIIAGYEYMDEKPFQNVYLTGIVRDKLRRKMSKSLGNSPDPLELIKEYGADGVRTGMLFSSPAGNDLLFDIKLCEQGRNFANKIWNAFRLLNTWEVADKPAPEANLFAVSWFEARLNEALKELENHFSKFRISDGLMTVYKLIWDHYCSWYLEMIKPPFGEAIDKPTYDATIDFQERLMKILHPFMPFISEEIWQQIEKRDSSKALIVAEWPQINEVDLNLVKAGDLAFEIITNVRSLRNANNLSPKDGLDLQIHSDKKSEIEPALAVVSKLANLSSVAFVDNKPDNCMHFVLQSGEYFIPTDGKIDTSSQISEIKKELDYNRGFLSSVLKKLENERFVNNAPEKVVEMERKKKNDAEAKIQALEEQLAKLQ